MTVVEVAALTMPGSDESDNGNEQNDDCNRYAASVFAESKANQNIHKDTHSDETYYHPSDSDAKIGPTDADNEDMRLLQISNLSQASGILRKQRIPK